VSFDAHYNSASILGTLQDWFRLLSDPDPFELERMIRVGEIVTWPKVRGHYNSLLAMLLISQLHMIGNRARIEKQILFGRQYVRTSSRKRTPRSEARSLLLDNTTPNPRPDPHMLVKSLSPPNTDSENPISVDTDAEDAFNRGSSWFFRRGHARASPPATSGATTPQHRSSTRDPLRMPGIRRKWTSELLSPTLNTPLKDWLSLHFM
jgi:hypothetical protein